MIQRDSTLSKEFLKQLSQNLNDESSTVKRMGVTVKSLQFYDESTYKFGHKILINVVTSRLMELYIFFGVLLYLIAMYYLLLTVSGAGASPAATEKIKKLELID